MKNVIVHALLAIVGLSWAYRVWTSEQETERPSAEVSYTLARGPIFNA
ncbi:MAG: hypothetical protein H6715_01870 [Myxococcales bacterium]|nr:hypothetical protein [Myxococcales bacterium]